MELKVLALFALLLCAGHCKPADSNDYDYDGIQNDNIEDYVEEGDDEGLEESNASEDDKPLEITTKGQEFVKNLSDTVILPCAITGSNYVQIWRKKNAIVKNSEKLDTVLFQSEISMAAAPNMRRLPDGSLEISNLHVQDDGIYECAAMDTAKNSPKIQHRLVLKVPPRIERLVVENNKTTLRSGETLRLVCTAGGYPEPQITWHKGAERFDIKGEVFEKMDVKHRDAGEYKCLADNKIGEPAFGSIHIRVQHKPIIVVDRITVSSESNSQTELECLVHSDPPSEVAWKKDGVDIVNTGRFQLINNENKHNLVLKDLRDSDFGEYTCVATNEIGATQKTIKLVKTPAVLRFMKSRQDGNVVVLTWEVQSKTNISEQEFLYRKKGEESWKRLSPEVSLINNGVYAVKYVFTKGLDPGEYETKMRSQNNNGWSEYSEAVSFEEAANSKHGHHKSHKKGHKHGKERQITPTQSTLNSDVPAEHHENENGIVAHTSLKAVESSCSSIIPSLLPISIALIVSLHLRRPLMRI